MSSKLEYFGKYILLEKLASGGMAEVFLAKTLGAEGVAKLVAVKRILPQFSTSNEFINMFKEEAKIAVNLSHPNIVSIMEFGVEQDQFYIAMEYVEGRNLRQIMNRMKELGRSFTQEQAIYVMSEAARGLDHAHRCIDGQTGKPLNIIHRDISPQNLMLSFEANVKVVDFGIAKAESQAEATRAGTLKGKFSYMSPEQAEGNEVDSRTDVFSLGIVLWEILANDRLFLANNEMNTLRKIKDCHIPSLHKLDPRIPPELEKIVNKALARDRNLRYQSAGELHKELNSFLNRNHPDFSSQDFSVVMKQLFAEELLESRRKLIEYAKVSFARGSDDKTAYIDINTSTRTEAESSTATPIENTDGPGIPLVKEDTDTRARRLGTLKPLPGRLREPTHYSPTITYQNSGPKAPTRPRRSSTITNYDEIRERSSFGPIFFFFLVGSIAFLFMASPQTFNALACKVSLKFCKDPTPALDDVGLKAPSPANQFDQSSTAEMVKATIISTPSGAQIYVDNVLKGQTPMELDLPSNKTLTLTIRRDGYSDQKRSIQLKGTETLKFNLKKMKIGYISVRVIPGDADIYIDDVRIDKAPIEMHKVPANARLRVRAINQYTGTSDEQIVMVREDSHQTINLFLKKPARDPASPR